MEYISREAVNDLIEDMRNNHFILMCERINLSLLKSKVAEIPAADVQPVKRGRWEKEYLEDDIWWAECSNCKQETHSRYGRPSTYRYCPNCGARMDLKDGDNDEDE